MFHHLCIIISLSTTFNQTLYFKNWDLIHGRLFSITSLCWKSFLFPQNAWGWTEGWLSSIFVWNVFWLSQFSVFFLVKSFKFVVLLVINWNNYVELRIKWFFSRNQGQSLAVKLFLNYFLFGKMIEDAFSFKSNSHIHSFLVLQKFYCMKRWTPRLNSCLTKLYVYVFLLLLLNCIMF